MSPGTGDFRGAASAAPRAVTHGSRKLRAGDLESARWAFVLGLAARRPTDPGEVLAGARRLGFDLHSGAAAICATGEGRMPELHCALAAATAGRILALVSVRDDITELRRALEDQGMTVAVSDPRSDPCGFHDALREAELMLELPQKVPSGESDTYRLLVGVLLRDPAELEKLRADTISPLTRYDREHEAELVVTLRRFLTHHGSTTDTAHAMDLHRHTVGYRLTRVQEVCGLSPYESGGRERLGLGLKADDILQADEARKLRH